MNRYNQHISKYYIRPVAILLIMCYTATKISAQDTLQPYRNFLQVCSGYQSAPLQLNLRYQPGTNLVLHNYDTASMQGYFYIGINQSYIRFGDAEQLIADSVALLINHSTKQVMLSRDIAKWKQQAGSYLGSITSDTSVLNLAQAFYSQEQVCDTNSLLRINALHSRVLLTHTNLPRQSIRLLFNTTTGEPLELTTLRRTIIPIQKEDSAAFVSRFGSAGVLVNVPSLGLCYVREYTATYHYTSIRHEVPESLPLVWTDYIMRNEEGEYVLREEKNMYRLSIED